MASFGGFTKQLEEKAGPVAVLTTAPGVGVISGAVNVAQGGGFKEGFSDPLGTLTGRRSDDRARDAQRNAEDAFNSVPDFRSIVDADGNLKSQFSSRSSEAANRIRNLSRGIGDPITGRLIANQNRQNTQALQDLQAQNQSLLQGNFSALASRGGLDAGARERLSQNAFNQSLFGQQRQGFENSQALGNIRADAATRQVSALNQAAQFDENDRALAIGGFQGQNQDAINRASALLESRLASADRPKGGLAGIIGG